MRWHVSLTSHCILNPGLLYQVTVSVLHRFYSNENTQSLHAHDINISLQPHLLVRQERRRPANKSLHPCYPITLHRAKKGGGGGSVWLQWQQNVWSWVIWRWQRYSGEQYAAALPDDIGARCCEERKILPHKTCSNGKTPSVSLCLTLWNKVMTLNYLWVKMLHFLLEKKKISQLIWDAWCIHLFFY